jgi:hypothetical protein
MIPENVNSKVIYFLLVKIFVSTKSTFITPSKFNTLIEQRNIFINFITSIYTKNITSFINNKIKYLREPYI